MVRGIALNFQNMPIEYLWLNIDMRLYEITAKSPDTLTLPTIEVGDEVMVGKFKNRKAVVTGFAADKHNQPILKTDKGEQKLFKPRLTKLEEGAVGLLSDVTTEAVIARIASGERDVTRSWVVRAYYAQEDSPDPKFNEKLGQEIEKAKAKLAAWAASPTTLFRGMSGPPKRGAVGVHWSPSTRTAYQHGKYIMTADVPVTSVDWIGTVLRRISWSEEEEIMLLPKTAILVKTLSLNQEVLAANITTKTS